MLKILESTDAMKVETLVVTVFGQPGLGKSTLANGAEAPLTLDFDRGSHRAGNRQRTVLMDAWVDVEELLGKHRPLLDGQQTLVLDTIGRCLDILSLDIIGKNPKHGAPGSGLSLQGWGALKSRFAAFVVGVRALGKDLVLVAHDKEEKDGDNRIIRPDIQGGSYGLVTQISDLMGYLSMQGGARTLNFSPTDASVGKNPCGWNPWRVPDVEQRPRFLADLIAEAKGKLSALSGEAALLSAQVEEWRAKIEASIKPADLTALLPGAKGLVPIVQAQVRTLLGARVRVLGLHFDAASGAYGAVAAQPAPPPAPAVPVERETQGGAVAYCDHAEARPHIARSKTGRKIVCPTCIMEVTAADLRQPASA